MPARVFASRLAPVAFAAVLALVLAPPIQAGEIVRSAALIETIPIQGITLATPPKDAVERLLAAGYRAGPIERYEDWTEPGLRLERGGPDAPEGESWVTLTRYEGRLIEITEMTNQPKRRFDPAQEVRRAQDHFGIAPDDPKCRSNGSAAGHCRVQDTAEAADVDLVFGLQVHVITLNRYATRKKAVKASLQ